MIYNQRGFIVFLLQLEDTKDFLCIHNGGSDNSEMVAKLTGQMNDTTISVSGNQMFVVFKSNHEIVARGFQAVIIESKYYDYALQFLMRNKKSRNSVTRNFSQEKQARKTIN